MLIVAPPDFAAREFDVPPQIRTTRRREQLRQVRRFENHPVDARPGTTPGLVQRVKMFAQRLEVDTQIAIARVGVEFDVIAVTIARIAGQRHRMPLRIDHRHHEIHRQPVLVGFVRLERPALRESRFAVDEGLRRRALCERRVRGRDRVRDASMRVRPAKTDADSAVGAEILALGRQLHGMLDAAFGGGAVADAVGGTD